MKKTEWGGEVIKYCRNSKFKGSMAESRAHEGELQVIFIGGAGRSARYDDCDNAIVLYVRVANL